MARIPPEAFDHYFKLGPARSYDAVARRFGVTKRAVTKCARRERWQQRVVELERKTRAETERRVVESGSELIERHLKLVKFIQAKALERLKSSPIENTRDAVRALDIALKHERELRGDTRDGGGTTAVQIIVSPEAEATLKERLRYYHNRGDGDDR